MKFLVQIDDRVVNYHEARYCRQVRAIECIERAVFDHFDILPDMTREEVIKVTRVVTDATDKA